VLRRIDQGRYEAARLRLETLATELSVVGWFLVSRRSFSQAPVWVYLNDQGEIARGNAPSAGTLICNLRRRALLNRTCIACTHRSWSC
jgi:hypothetical protein